MGPPQLSPKIYTKEELCVLEEIPEPCAVVIFGASGDLTQRKLLPSLYFLQTEKRLPDNFYILGVARTKMSDDAFRERVREALPTGADPEQAARFTARCFYQCGGYDNEDLYRDLHGRLNELDRRFNVERRRLFYLSVPPALYTSVIKNLGESDLTPATSLTTGWSRVVIEKPFGESLASARTLNHEIKRHLREDQIYRIDHYLGKETVQNIMMFRFANIMFDPVWNRNYVDHIQITASEEIGVEHRAGYYDKAGVLRDMFQNHLLQLLALITMDPPYGLDSEAVRDRKIGVFRSLRVWSEREVRENSVCAQYAAGTVGDATVRGYLDEPGVDSRSRTATFAAVRFEIDNWRWQGVPVFMRAGKRMAQRRVEIAIQFKSVPTSIFKPLNPDQLSPNVLKFRIQPDEAIIMRFEAKHPGPKLCLGTVTMDFCYEEAFQSPPPESYVRLFHDAMIGDQTLFSRSDGVEECWGIMDPIIQHWESAAGPPLSTYRSGTWGPDEADLLIARNGRKWL